MQLADFHRTGSVGLALAGGGPEGAIYEIGVLRALDDALDGLDFNDVPVTVGVSAGALLGASLANGITTGRLVRSVVGEETGEQPFRPEMFMSPAFGEYVKSGLRVPGLIADALQAALRDPKSSGVLTELVSRLGRAVPVGVFDNAPLRDYLAALFALGRRTDDFRRLKNKLFVVATDLDSSETVVFGAPGHDDVPISRAVQASTALPGLYPPVEIDGRHYVDGVLNKTVHASVAFEEGAELVLCINPIVPVDTAQAVANGVMERGRLTDRGMPGVMSQTFRTLIHSRMGTGMASYRDRFENADLVLFEPRKDDYLMFFTNVFSFAARREVRDRWAHAYPLARVVLCSTRLGPELVGQHPEHGLDDGPRRAHPQPVGPVAVRAPRRALDPVAVARRRVPEVGAAVVVVAEDVAGGRRRDRGQHPPGHAALALVGRRERELHDRALVGDRRVEPEPEEQLPAARADVVGGLRDRPGSGLAPDDLDGLDRRRVHDEPPGGLSEPRREAGEERSPDADERLAAAVVAAGREEAGEEVGVVAAGLPDEAGLGVVGPGLLQDREREDLGVAQAHPAVAGPEPDGVGDEVAVEVVDEAEEDEREGRRRGGR